MSAKRWVTDCNDAAFSFALWPPAAKACLSISSPSVGDGTTWRVRASWPGRGKLKGQEKSISVYAQAHRIAGTGLLRFLLFFLAPGKKYDDVTLSDIIYFSSSFPSGLLIFLSHCPVKRTGDNQHRI